MPQPLTSGAHKLTRYLASNDLTQEQFAELAGVPGPQVSMWRNGRRRPSINSALVIEEATGGFITVRDWALPRKVKKSTRTA